MADEVRAIPSELVNLAGETLTASIMLGDSWRSAQAGLSVAAIAFGNLGTSKGAYDSHVNACGNGGTAIDRLILVYEDDVDRLYRIAFAYQQADTKAAEESRETQYQAMYGPHD